jgi:hypothetical protein
MPQNETRDSYKVKVRKYLTSDLSIYALGWYDNRPVHLLSTFDSPIARVLRNVKIGGAYIGLGLGLGFRGGGLLVYFSCIMQISLLWTATLKSKDAENKLSKQGKISSYELAVSSNMNSLHIHYFLMNSTVLLKGRKLEGYLQLCLKFQKLIATFGLKLYRRYPFCNDIKFIAKLYRIWNLLHF